MIDNILGNPYLNQFKYLKTTFIQGLILLLLLLLGGEGAQFAALLVYSILIIPALLIHFSYLLHCNKIVIDKQKKIILVNCSSTQKEYQFDDIMEVKVFRSYTLDAKFNIPVSALLDYYFIRIKFNDGKAIELTCFLINDFNKVVQIFNFKTIQWVKNGPMFLFRTHDIF